MIDKNDVLGTIQIYNAAAMGLGPDLKFEVTATTPDGTVQLGDTMDYDANADRLVWKAPDGQADLQMPTLQSVTFTKAS